MITPVKRTPMRRRNGQRGASGYRTAFGCRTASGGVNTWRRPGGLPDMDPSDEVAPRDPAGAQKNANKNNEVKSPTAISYRPRRARSADLIGYGKNNIITACFASKK